MKCNKCGQEKNEAEFTERAKHGKKCRDCCNEYRKNWKREFRKVYRECTSCNQKLELNQFLPKGSHYNKICIPCLQKHSKKDFKSIREQNLILSLESKRMCTCCKVVKPKDSFVKSKRTTSGYSSFCKSCSNIKSKAVKLKQYYGLTLIDLNKLLIEQNNSCLICKEEISFNKETNKARAVIDHCHKHGHVRGILCISCNGGLGLFKDNLQSLYSAIKYLKLDHLKLGELRGSPVVDNPDLNINLND